MKRKDAGVADIFRRAGADYRRRLAGQLDAGRLKVMAAIESCRTSVLGGHMYQCDGCRREHPLYNSCRNRHCPSCQGLAARQWLEARAADILPVPYFHVVFSLPKEVSGIAFCNRKVVFNILFRTAAETLRTIAEDDRHGGLRIGGTAVLHTWDQKLGFHPHLHIVVPNAGFDVATGQWKTGSGTFLAPVKVLASLFRRRFLEELTRAHARGKIEFHGGIAHLANPGEFHATLVAARGKTGSSTPNDPFAMPNRSSAISPDTRTELPSATAASSPAMDRTSPSVAASRPVRGKGNPATARPPSPPTSSSAGSCCMSCQTDCIASATSESLPMEAVPRPSKSRARRWV